MSEATTRVDADSAARFRQLVGWWAESLGRHHVPLREHTDDINNFIGPDAVHHEVIQQVVRAVYCANSCGHLDADVTLEDTFTALGEVKTVLLNSPHADIDQINLVDSIGWHTRQFFGLAAQADTPPTGAEVDPAGEVPLPEAG